MILVKNYKSETNEIASFLIEEANYKDIVLQSKIVLENLKLDFPMTNGFSLNDLWQAKQELLRSFNFSLANVENPHYSNLGCYSLLDDSWKLHKRLNGVYVQGILVKKEIISPGLKLKINSSRLTLAKNYLLSKTKLSKWIQLSINDNYQLIRKL